MSAPAAVDRPWAFQGQYHEAQNLRDPDQVALRSSLAVKMMPVAITTFALAQWVSAMLGALRLETMVITFTWTIATCHQFMTARRADQLQKFRWSSDTIVSALSGQILWVVLPCVQLANPSAWFSATMTTPPMIGAVSGVVAVAWSMRPLVMRLLGRHAAPLHSQLDAGVLYCTFFLLSGNLVFASSAYASVVALLAGRFNWRALTSSFQVQPQILACPIES
jgi:hypothetical protein